MNEQNHLNTLSLAYDLGADYIDVEFEAVTTFVSQRSEKNCKIIVSSYIRVAIKI